MKPLNILIASVGGQGGLTLARVLATSAVLQGLSVRTSESLGMAQRYGSVVGYIRIGEEIYSPIFEPGEADYLLGLELNETLRNLHYVKPSGKIIVADEYRPSYEMSMASPNITRNEVISEMLSINPNLLVIPARKIALKLGNPRALNMVILGVFVGLSGIPRIEYVEKAISEILTGASAEISVVAFREGLKFVTKNSLNL
ncbi:MAG: indolepyruvate oxidoreductase subunit beta [Desulfurococcaceae archaeon]